MCTACRLSGNRGDVRHERAAAKGRLGSAALPAVRVTLGKEQAVSQPLIDDDPSHLADAPRVRTDEVLAHEVGVAQHDARNGAEPVGVEPRVALVEGAVGVENIF